VVPVQDHVSQGRGHERSRAAQERFAQVLSVLAVHDGLPDDSVGYLLKPLRAAPEDRFSFLDDEPDEPELVQLGQDCESWFNESEWRGERQAPCRQRAHGDAHGLRDSTGRRTKY
jgi:hypothetical protein